MQIDVTFRRMEASDAIKTYLNDKMDKMKKFLANSWHAKVVLTSERFRNKADVSLTLGNGLLIKGVDTSEDMYFSIDQAMTRIEKQLRKYKEKIHNHKPSLSPALKFKSSVIEQSKAEEFKVDRFEYDEEEEPAKAEDYVEEVIEEKEVETPKIVRTNEYNAHPMDIEEAIMQLELMDKKFLVFTNKNTSSINVIYYREDGQYGLIETNHE